MSINTTRSLNSIFSKITSRDPQNNLFILSAFNLLECELVTRPIIFNKNSKKPIFFESRKDFYSLFSVYIDENTPKDIIEYIENIEKTLNDNDNENIIQRQNDSLNSKYIPRVFVCSVENMNSLDLNTYVSSMLNDPSLKGLNQIKYKLTSLITSYKEGSQQFPINKLYLQGSKSSDVIITYENIEKLNKLNERTKMDIIKKITWKSKTIQNMQVKEVFEKNIYLHIHATNKLIPLFFSYTMEYYENINIFFNTMIQLNDHSDTTVYLSHTNTICYEYNNIYAQLATILPRYSSLSPAKFKDRIQFTLTLVDEINNMESKYSTLTENIKNYSSLIINQEAIERNKNKFLQSMSNINNDDDDFLEDFFEGRKQRKTSLDAKVIDPRDITDDIVIINNKNDKPISKNEIEISKRKKYRAKVFQREVIKDDQGDIWIPMKNKKIPDNATVITIKGNRARRPYNVNKRTKPNDDDSFLTRKEIESLQSTLERQKAIDSTYEHINQMNAEIAKVYEEIEEEKNDAFLDELDELVKKDDDEIEITREDLRKANDIIHQSPERVKTSARNRFNYIINTENPVFKPEYSIVERKDVHLKDYIAYLPDVIEILDSPIPNGSNDPLPSDVNNTVVDNRNVNEVDVFIQPISTVIDPGLPDIDFSDDKVDSQAIRNVLPPSP